MPGIARKSTWELALTDLTARLADMAQEVAANPGSPLFPELASALVAAGRYTDAVAVCERGLAACESIEGLQVLAEALLLLGDFTSARSRAEAVLSSQPESAVALRVLGASWLSLGDPESARKNLEQSARLDPSDMQTLDLLAKLSDDLPLIEAHGDLPEVDSAGSAEATEGLDFQESQYGELPSPAESDCMGLGPSDPDLGSEIPPAEPGMPSYERDAAGEAAPPATPQDADETDDDPLSLGWSAPSSTVSGSDAISRTPLELDLPPNVDSVGVSPLEALSDEASAPLELDLPPALDSVGVSPLEALSNDACDTLELDLPKEKEEEFHPAHNNGSRDDSSDFHDHGPARGSKGKPVSRSSKESPASSSPKRPRDTAFSSQSSASPTSPSDSSSKKREIEAVDPKAGIDPYQAAAAKPVEAGPPAPPLWSWPPPPRARRLGMLGVGLLGVLVAVLFVLSSWKAQRAEESFARALAAARSAMAADTRTGYEQALVELEGALAIKRSSPYALGLAAFSATRLHTEFDGGVETAMAAEDYLAAAEIQEVLSPEASAARGLFELARARPADAVSTTARGLSNNPGHPALLWVRAKAELALDRQDLALATLGQARARDASFIPAKSDLAGLLASSGRTAEALAIRLEILEHQPSHAQTLTELLEDARVGRADPALVLERTLGASRHWVHIAPPILCRLHLAMAKVALRANQPAIASEAEDRARQVQNAPSCQMELGLHLLGRHRMTEAYRVLSVAGSSGEEQARAYAAMAALLSARPELVIELLGSPKNPRETTLLARALYDSGQSKEALQLLGSLPPESSSASSLAVLALSLLEAGDVARSRQASRALFRAGAPDTDAYFVGLAWLEMNNPRHATMILERLIRTADEPSYFLLFAAARASWSAGDLQAALQHLERAIALNPDEESAVETYLEIAPRNRANGFFGKQEEPLASALLGIADAFAGDLHSAQRRHETASGTGSGGWTSLLGAMLEHGGGGGTDALRRELMRSPTSMIPRVLLADTLIEAGRFKEGSEVIRDGLKRRPEHVRGRSRALEILALQGGDAEEIVRVARRLLLDLRTNPTDSVSRARVHGALALGCAAAGDSACARQASTTARREAPNDGRTLVLVGRALESSGASAMARATYLAAAGKDGGSEALFRLALLSNPTDPARLREFLDRAPADHPLAAEARRILSSSD